MLKRILGIAPTQETDGSFSPSKLALKLSTSNVSDYEHVAYAPYQGERDKILVIFTEQKNMTMQNGKEFSTGNHPVEALLPMLHLRNAGFEFEIATPSGKPVVFEMWAMPRGDEEVVGIYEELKARLEQPRPLQDVVDGFLDEIGSYSAVFVPGGHGAMLGIPEDPNVGTILRWAHEYDLFTISICRPRHCPTHSGQQRVVHHLVLATVNNVLLKLEFTDHESRVLVGFGVKQLVL